jgi:protein-ribulosamine 3-kinase
MKMSLQVKSKMLELFLVSANPNFLALPLGTNVKGIFPHGTSYWCGWTRTSEIRTEQANGSELSFFLKVSRILQLIPSDVDLRVSQVSQTEAGKKMVEQEFESMRTLYEIVPHLLPKPISHGTYAANPNIHFVVSEFVEMTDDVPDPSFMASLADLHARTVSPNNKYGFSIPTYQRAMPQYTEWTESWEDFFTNSLRHVFEFEEKTHGLDRELKVLERAILQKVVPRLLRPLETGGRTIRPRLIHGDVWDGNVSTKVADDSPILFDASCIYAHNEGDSAINHLLRVQYLLTGQPNLGL